MAARPIYLDHNATTPLDPGVLEAMLPFLREEFGNPRSSHAYGRAAREAVEAARAEVSALIGSTPAEIIFTSGGSESNNAVIKGVAASAGAGRGRFVTTAVEHPSVLDACRRLQQEGFSLEIVPVDPLGRVSAKEIESRMSRDTILVSVMHAQNEVGTIQPIEEIGEAARSRSLPFHCDASQSVGKLAVDVGAMRVDFLTVAGHKFYGPKGVGALYIRAGRALPALIQGAGHEQGRRSGTENVPGIVGLGKACALARARLEATARHLLALRERLWNGLAREFPGLRRNGDPERSLPNTLSVSFRGVPASILLMEIGDRVAASAGAACHSEGVRPSAVMEAMRVPLEDAMGTIRFSLGRSNTEEQIDEAIRVVSTAVRARA